MTNELLHAAFSLARRQGGSLERPLLVVLDEAAAIAPIKELDVIAATCASHGITLVTCFQDIAQIRARYGERWATVVNNHRTRIFLSGLADPNVSEVLGSLTGEIAGPAPRSTVKGSPAFSSPRRRLIEPHDLRVLPSFRGIVISGSLPPFRLALVPWWKSERRQPRGAEVPAGYAGIRDHLRRLRPPVVDRPHPTGRPDQGREPRPSR
jgi:type IV secretory pathway TraG/TraD family ATPase VirD4